MDGMSARASNIAMKLAVRPATFDEWRRALNGAQVVIMAADPFVAAPVSGIAAQMLPAEMPPLPDITIRASFDQVKRMLSQGASEPILAAAGVQPDVFHDKFALGNVSPSKMEAFLSRYHNQAFAVFAVGAILLLWVM